MPLQRAARSVLLAVCAGLAAAAPARGLVGDCNDNGVVSISELVTGVSIALGSAPLERCEAVDANADGAVTINELILAVAAALAPPVTPTPRFVIIDLGVAGGQTCGVTQATFAIPDDPLVSIRALRIEFCVDENSFDVEAVTCVSFDPTVSIDAVETRRECRLTSPSAPAGQVTVRVHGVGGGSGDAFEPGDAIQCSIPVLADTGEGDYTLRFLVVADTSAGAVANAGQGTIHVFGLPDTDRFQGECCSADSQCQSGFCRGGDASQNVVCCESDCAGGICNDAFFVGSCCAASGLPDNCNQP